jgi:uncharacterized protein (DUF2141 family)
MTLRTSSIGLLLALAGAALAATPARASDLKVTIVGVPSDAGALMIGLYDSAASFEGAIANSTKVSLLKDKGRLVGVTMRARTGSQSIGFTQLSPGRHAIIVFHDQNDNGLLDESLLGIPTEAYGFSNNAMGFLSAPSFDAAAVTLAGDQSISITLHLPNAPSATVRFTK